MKPSLLFAASIVSALASTDCLDCTELGCSGVSVILSNVLTKHAADLPISIHACFDGSCADATVTAEACTSQGEFICVLGDDSSVELDLQREPTSNDGHTLQVTLEGPDGAVLFDTTRPVTLSTSHPGASPQIMPRISRNTACSRTIRSNAVMSGTSQSSRMVGIQSYQKSP